MPIAIFSKIPLLRMVKLTEMKMLNWAKMSLNCGGRKFGKEHPCGRMAKFEKVTLEGRTGVVGPNLGGYGHALQISWAFGNRSDPVLCTCQCLPRGGGGAADIPPGHTLRNSDFWNFLLSYSLGGGESMKGRVPIFKYGWIYLPLNTFSVP